LYKNIGLWYIITDQSGTQHLEFGSELLLID